MHSPAVLLLLLALTTNACERTHLHRRSSHPPASHLKRDDGEFPPVLTAEETLLVNSFDAVSIDGWSDYYGHQVKIAGKGKAAAEWTRDRWAESGFDASLNEYHVYLSYPLHQSLSISYPDGTTDEVNLQEDVLEEDDVTGREDRQGTFHGYSASGNVSAEYIYCGRGTFDDFKKLEDLGVEMEGKIALIKYGVIFRGLKVKNAQDHGMIGAVLFIDPGDDGDITVANGYEAYPDGPARNPSAVQKGSTLFLSSYPGDPSTPGYPSHEGVPRADVSAVTPQIPSVPISYAAAVPILQALDSHGFSAEEVNRTGWPGALDAEYRTGPAPGVTLNLENLMDNVITPIWNVIGFMNGTNSDETLVIGNHRDTWMIGGNGDPNSGSAIMVEMAKALGRLKDSGWVPKRNIVLGSWDGEEYGLIGSTEWVEEHVNWLTETAVAYLNIDVAVSGPRPDVATTPDLHAFSTALMKKVVYPTEGAFNSSLYDAWMENTEGEIGVLGSGSDYTAFLHKGITSLDTGSSGSASKGDPIWMYHSNYDTYHWMSTFGDPGFHMHATMGQYLSLMAYHLSTDTVLPFDPPNYAVELRAYLSDLQELMEEYGADLDLSELEAAVGEFETRAGEVKTLEMLAVSMGDEELVEVVNHKYRDFQRGFVSQGGLPDREFYRHVVMAPGLDTGYAAVTYPGVSEGIQYGNLDVAQEWVAKTARGIIRAADIIKT